MVIPTFSGLRAVVVGDIMLDQFWFGKATKLSPEAPVPVVVASQESDSLGGAANVAANLRAMGCDVVLSGYIANDAYGEKVRELLCDMGIKLVAGEAASPTVTKTRIIANDQHVLRYDREKPFEPTDAEQERLVDQLSYLHTDVVFFSDYDKGTVTKSLVDGVRGLAGQAPLIVDCKPKNAGLFSGFHTMTPNRAEASVLVPGVDEEKASEEIRNRYCLNTVVLTMSERGVLVRDSSGCSHIPAFQYVPVEERHHRLDVAGAGDTLTSVYGCCLASGMSPRMAAWYGNVAAAVVVNKLGTSVCTSEEFSEAVRQGEMLGKKVDADIRGTC